MFAAAGPASTLRPMTDYDFTDLEALAAWLDDPALPDGALSLPALEGYLVAIAIHAPNLAPQHWLPPIWGYPPGAHVPIDPQRGDRDRLVNLVIELHRDWLLHLRCRRGN